MNFAKTIKSLRDNAKMTQQELANASNFRSSVSISQFEKGNAIPRFEASCRICAALNISLLEFYLLSVEPEDLYSSNPQRQKYVEGVVKRLGKRITTESQIKSILDAVE